MMIKSFLMEHLPGLSLALAGLGLLGLGLVLYGLRRKSGGSAPPLAHRWEKSVDELATSSPDLMGKAAPEEGVQVVSAEDFGFTGQAKPALDRQDQLGLLADVQQEIKSVCAVLEQRDGSKEDFFSMFELLKAKYPKMAGHPALSQLRSFIRERVPFHLSDEELEGLWG